jgi:hypothetical protein
MHTLRMHKYIWGWVGLFLVFGVTYFIAMARVSQSEKYAGQALKSLLCHGKFPKERVVVSWLETCRSMQVEPLKKP